MEEKYIIISLKHGTGKDPVFWRAGNCGYTSSPFAAGVYTKQDIESDPYYYNNGESTIALPLTDKALYAIGFRCSFEVQRLLDWHIKNPITKTEESAHDETK